MRKVTVYTTRSCPYCIRVKNFFSSQLIPFNEIDLSSSPDELEKLKSRTGWFTVPQVFFDDELIGGCDDVLALHRNGTLNDRLGMIG